MRSRLGLAESASWRFPVAFLAIVMVLAAAAPSSALIVQRHPWLSLQTPTSMLVTWQTDVLSTSQVLYGPDPVADWSTASQEIQAGTTIDHAVPLTGLSPATRYRYKVVSNLD